MGSGWVTTVCATVVRPSLHSVWTFLQRPNSSASADVGGTATSPQRHNGRVAGVHLTGKKKARKKRQSYDVPGHAHFLTFSCYRRRTYLETDVAKDAFVECLVASKKRLGFEVIAYVVMPEHVHLLVFPREGLKVRSVLQSIKQPVARRLGTRGERFWQPGGGHDRNIHTRKAAGAVIDYIHDNPVHRGLCAVREDYRWSSARWYAYRTGPVVVNPW